ncbi:MAG: hypothetical protein Kow00129_10850 [Thermoleophilia bacterium]
MSRRRTIYAGVVLLLLGVLGGLVYALLSLGQTARSFEVEVAPGFRHIRSIYGASEELEDLLHGPYGISAREGEIFVSDNQKAAVYVFNTDGEFLRRIGEKGRGPGQLVQPLGIHVDEQGRLYVADRGHNKVVVYDVEGDLIDEIVFQEQAPVVPYTADSKLYVATEGPIGLFDQSSRQFLTSWGERGRSQDEFDYVNGLVWDEQNDRMIVSDTNNLRLKAVDSDGVAQWVLGGRTESGLTEEGKRLFGLPSGITLVEGIVYVADPLNNVIHLVSSEGEYLAEVGETGSEEGYFSFPTHIAYLGDNRFAVTEWGNGRVQIVEINAESAIDGYEKEKEERLAPPRFEDEEEIGGPVTTSTAPVTASSAPTSALVTTSTAP